MKKLYPLLLVGLIGWLVAIVGVAAQNKYSNPPTIFPPGFDPTKLVPRSDMPTQILRQVAIKEVYEGYYITTGYILERKWELSDGHSEWRKIPMVEIPIVNGTADLNDPMEPYDASFTIYQNK